MGWNAIAVFCPVGWALFWLAVLEKGQPKIKQQPKSSDTAHHFCPILPIDSPISWENLGGNAFTHTGQF